MNIKNEDLMKQILSKKLINKTATFTAHRPKYLYGYNLNNPMYNKLAWKVYHHCENLVLNNGVRYFISGCALGGDTVCFFAIEQLKKKYPNLNIKNILAIPFWDIYVKWSKIDIDRYKRMINLCDSYIAVDTIKEYNPWGYEEGSYHKNKLNSRNSFLVDYSAYITAITLGIPSGTENCLRYVRDKRKDMDIYIINPQKI